jgi:branched-chain amino acid transport system substrate-binding protein
MRGVGLLRTRRARLGACLALLALVLTSCSSTAATGSAVTVAGSTLVVYASQPPGAADATSSDVLDAEQLAFKQAGSNVGRFTVKLATVHDYETSADARAAVQDKRAIAYLGEIAPGTSGVSVEISNQVGLLQVSPTDTAVYLTQSSPAVSGAPGHYYPASSTFHDTFARVVPTTVQEAKALVAEMQSLHLTKLYVSSDGSAYGASVALEVRQDAGTAGITLATGVTGADAVFYGGTAGPRATKALDQAASSSPAAKLFAPSALYDDSFVASLSAAAQQNLYVSAPGVAPSHQTAAQKAFASAFQTAYGHPPAPQAIFGYEAMSAVMSVLRGAGANANSRALVVARFRALKDRQSALGTYSIQNGDTDIASFVIGHPAGGRLVPRSQP